MLLQIFILCVLALNTELQIVIPGDIITDLDDYMYSELAIWITENVTTEAPPRSPVTEGTAGRKISLPTSTFHSISTSTSPPKTLDSSNTPRLTQNPNPSPPVYQPPTINPNNIITSITKSSNKPLPTQNSNIVSFDPSLTITQPSTDRPIIIETSITTILNLTQTPQIDNNQQLPPALPDSAPEHSSIIYSSIGGLSFLGVLLGSILLYKIYNRTNRYRAPEQSQPSHHSTDSPDPPEQSIPLQNLTPFTRVQRPSEPPPPPPNDPVYAQIERQHPPPKKISVNIDIPLNVITTVDDLSRTAMGRGTVIETDV